VILEGFREEVGGIWTHRCGQDFFFFLRNSSHFFKATQSLPSCCLGPAGWNCPLFLRPSEPISSNSCELPPYTGLFAASPPNIGRFGGRNQVCSLNTTRQHCPSLPYFSKKCVLSGWWLKPEIPVTQQAEIERITVSGQPGQKFLEIPS
jgi:hypothetical protein